MSRIVTFYSYKGGVGRTFALANVAVLLAQRRKQVLAIDWDLEAPGLHRYFEAQASDPNGHKTGLIHLLTRAADDKDVRWEEVVESVHFADGSEIDVILSGEHSSEYSELVRAFSWKGFFESGRGGAVLERWRNEWKRKYDFVLIDSRTGITDAGGICTVLLPDIVVLVFSANQQSFEGAVRAGLGIQDARQRLDVPRPLAAVLPLPSRFDGRDEVGDAGIWLDRFGLELKRFYDDWLPVQFEARQMLELTKIPYVSKFSFGEPLAVLTHGVSNPDYPGYYLDNVARLLVSDFRDAGDIISPDDWHSAESEPALPTIQPEISLGSGLDHMNALYQTLDPLQPLPADDTQLYVDWQHELFASDDIKLQLARGFARCVPGVPVTRLFTGHRGTGKTTELNRVKQMLEKPTGGLAPGRRIFVSFLECEKWVDLNNLEPPDLMLQMVRQLVLDLKEVGFGNALTKVRGFFGELAEVLNADVELKDLRLKGDPFEIGVAIKQVPGARAKLRKHLEDRLPRIYDLVNSEILQPAREWLAGEGYQDVLIIVDQLDRIPQRQLNDRGLTNHEQLFLNSADVLRSLQCNVLYTIPIELAYSHCHGRLADVYGGAILTLPMITVSGAAGQKGIERLIEIVRRRAEKAKIGDLADLCAPEDLRRICQLSGGHPRSLFTLLRSAIDRSDRLPLETQTIGRAILQQASEFRKSLSEEDWKALREVHSTREALNANPALWMTFLRERYVYAYYDAENDGLWYDWNPLLGEVKKP